MTGNTFRARQAEIRQLQLADFAYQQVLRFHIAMQNAPLMAIGEAAQQLEQKQSNVSMIETAWVALHVLGEISVLMEIR